MITKEDMDFAWESGVAYGRSQAKSKHTAGPWEVTHGNDQAKDIAYVRVAGTNYSDFDKEVCVCYPVNSQCEANALLIAKAPQLLEFSQQVIEAFFEEYEHDESAPENSITVIAIRRLQAVIREAKGLSEPDRTKGTNLTDTHKPQPQPTKPSPRPTPDDANPPGQPGGK